MVCYCRAGLNLHVSDDKDPKTKMLIAAANQHSSSSASESAGAFTAALEPLICFIHYPPRSPTGAGDGGVYALGPSSAKL